MSKVPFTVPVAISKTALVASPLFAPRTVVPPLHCQSGYEPPPARTRRLRRWATATLEVIEPLTTSPAAALPPSKCPPAAAAAVMLIGPLNVAEPEDGPVSSPRADAPALAP